MGVRTTAERRAKHRWANIVQVDRGGCQGEMFLEIGARNAILTNCSRSSEAVIVSQNEPPAASRDSYLTSKQKPHSEQLESPGAALSRLAQMLDDVGANT